MNGLIKFLKSKTLSGHQITIPRAKENIVTPSEKRRVELDVFGDLSKMICNTIGPAGGNTLVTEPYATTPIFPTKDGFRVMNNHNYDDIYYESIYRIIRDICGRMNTAVGDGTTSGIPIGNNLYRKLIGYMSKHRELTPFGVKKILDEILKTVCDVLKNNGYVQNISELSKECRVEIYRKIATISANNDSYIANMVAEAYAASDSPETFIDIQQATGEEDSVDKDLGFELTSGYLIRHMANNADGVTAEYDKPLYLLIDGPLLDHDVNALKQFIEWGCINQGFPMVVIASEFSKNAMDFFVKCRTAYPVGRNGQLVKLPVLAMIVNTMSEYGIARMGDLEAALGAKSIQTNTGRLQNCPNNEQEFLALCGRSDNITMKPHYARIRGGAGTPEERKARIDELEQLVKQASDGGTKGLMEMGRIEMLKRRIGMLRGEMHCIHVGGDSFKEKQSRALIFEDAVMAVRACVVNGVTLGGNVSIKHAIMHHRDDIVSAIMKSLYDGQTHNVLIGGSMMKVEKTIDALLDIVAEASTSAFRAVFANATTDKKFIKNCFADFYQDPEYPRTYDLIKGRFQMFPRCGNTKFNDTPNQILETTKLFGKDQDAEIIKYVKDDLPSLMVPGNTDTELLRSVFSILGLFLTSNQLMSVHVQKENKI